MLQHLQAEDMSNSYISTAPAATIGAGMRNM
jgi:hypothetical protein